MREETRKMREPWSVLKLFRVGRQAAVADKFQRGKGRHQACPRPPGFCDQLGPPTGHGGALSFPNVIPNNGNHGRHMCT